MLTVCGAAVRGALCLILLSLAFAGSAQAQERFAAIAYSAKACAIGVASDNASQAEAESVALSNCRAEAPSADDCRGVMWARNACAVIAIGEDGGWGTHWGADVTTAERNAMTTCAKYSKTCRVVRRVCTSKD